MNPTPNAHNHRPQTVPGAAIEASPESIKRSSRRIDSIDLLRGIVMVIMMLDHTRDFLHNAVFQFDPTDLSRTNVALFFTRWITHFCAPVFVFLAGTGPYLQFARGKSKKELSRFLITRGLWLIVLEFTVVRFAFTFNFDYRFLGAMQVIWVIGVSMIILGVLIYLPLKAIAAFGIAMIALHNLLDGIQVNTWQGPGSAVPGFWERVWLILHQPFNVLPVFGFPGPVAFVIYPLIPWVGVMAVGYAFGAFYQLSPERRRKALLITGGLATLSFVIATLSFVILRVIVYGDPAPWSRQPTFVFTILYFLNTTKYPPSLLFLLMTLGPSILALAWFESGPASPRYTFQLRLRNALVTFGRVPLFFYVLQWTTAHIISIVLHWLAGKPVDWLFRSPVENFAPPQGVGFSLWVVYVGWIVGVILLYPLCKWFAGVKQRRRDWWLSYL